MANHRLVFKAPPPYLPPSTGVGSGLILSVTILSDGILNVAFELELGDIPSPDVLEGDIVRISNGNDFIYGVFKRWLPGQPAGQGGFQMTYDYDMYYSDPTTMAFFATYPSGYNLYQTINDKVESYRLTYAFSRATYSKLMLTYNTKMEYFLTIDDKRRFLVGEMLPALISDDLFLVDPCKTQGDVCYKISLMEDSFEAYNNKFKKTIQFKIAVP